MTVQQISIFVENKQGTLLKVLELLKEAGISVAISDVFALTLDNVPGRAADAVRILTQEGIGITYMYSFLYEGKGILIFRTDNPDKTRNVIENNNLSYITDEDLTLKVK